MKLRFYRPLLTNVPVEPEWRALIAPTLGEVRLPLVEALPPLLDGSHSLEEVYGALLVQGYALESVSSALYWLHERGLLQEAPGTAANLLSEAELDCYRNQAAVLTHLASPHRRGKAGEDHFAGLTGQARLKQSVVTLIGLGNAGRDFARSLVLAGVGHTIAASEGSAALPLTEEAQAEFQALNPYVRFTGVNQPEEIPDALGEVSPDLMVYCPDRFDESFCEWLNKVCLEISVPLLLYRIRLEAIEIGPLILPRETACYVCYDRRLRGTMASRHVSPGETETGEVCLNFPLGTQLLALEAIKFLSVVAEPVTRSRVWSLNLRTGNMETHPVLKLPRCPACGVHRTRPERKLWEEQE